MFCNMMVYVRIALTTLATFYACLLGDGFVELTQHPLLRALADNATHALVGALAGIAYIMQFQEKIGNLLGWILIFLCFLFSSLIDVDHFIEARSFHLEDATNLQRRPFLHCSSIIWVLCIFYVSTACLNYFRASLAFGIVMCAFMTHHTRDAVRRGYWIFPFGHTSRISQLSYITLTVLTPYILGYLHMICRNAVLQQWISQYVHLVESTTHRSGYRYQHV